jgi:hypothetical protein
MLYKLKLFHEAEMELQQFENFEKSEFYFQTYADIHPNQTGELFKFYIFYLNFKFFILFYYL